MTYFDVKRFWASLVHRTLHFTPKTNKKNTNLHIVLERRGMYIPGGGGGGGTPIYGLYRYVPRDRVCFLRFSVLK